MGIKRTFQERGYSLRLEYLGEIKIGTKHQQNMNRKNTINDLTSDIVQRFAVPHVWIMGDKNLKEYLGGGSPKIFARWRSGTKKGNILKYRLTEKAFMYRTDWVDEFIDKEFSVEEVNLKF